MLNMEMLFFLVFFLQQNVTFETQDIFKLQHLKHLSDYECFSSPVLAVKHFHLMSEHVSRCAFYCVLFLPGFV